MFRRIQVILMIWLLVLVPFYVGLKYIEFSSTDNVNACMETFLETENKNISRNISQKIEHNISIYKLLEHIIDFDKKDEEEYLSSIFNKFKKDNPNILNIKISNESGKVLYTSDKEDYNDFLHDKDFKNAENGKCVYDIFSLDEQSNSIGISYFFSISVKKGEKSQKYLVKITEPWKNLSSYLEKIDQGIFPRFFYVVSPNFTKYISLSGIFTKPSNKNMAVSLGYHLAKELKNEMKDGGKLFKIRGKTFNINIASIKLSDNTIGPKLFSVISAYSDSIAVLSEELLMGIPLALLFAAIFTILVSLVMSRSFIKIETKLSISEGITAATPLPIIIFDIKTGSIKEINSPASMLFRAVREDLIKYDAWKLFINDNDKQYVINAINAGIPVQDYELILQCVDGATFWSVLSASPIYIDDKLYIVMGVYDISHRKEFEKKLSRDAKRLEQQVLERTKDIEKQALKLAESNKSLEEAKMLADKANKAKTKFLTNMSNELRASINSIIGYSEVLVEEARERKDDVSANDSLKIIAAAKHLLSMINEITDLSNIEAGKISVNIENFDIFKTMQDINDVARPLFMENDNTFTVECPENIGAMRCDLVKLRQGILNLLGNAAKFTKKGEILLKIRDLVKEKENYIEFIVRDTGIGMTKEQLSNLFHSFEDSSGETGLGLIITKKYCDILGGKISIDSEFGVGSEFKITLPRICGNIGENLGYELNNNDDQNDKKDIAPEKEMENKIELDDNNNDITNDIKYEQNQDLNEKTEEIVKKERYTTVTFDVE